jgi:hypothetical protein
MSNRSTYLARTLLARARGLTEGMEGEGTTAEQHERMRELVAKVLAVEEGITEETKVRLVLDALPAVRAGRAPSDRDLQELAGCLEGQLWR